MNISDIFIKRPVATTLLTIGMVLLGLLCFNELPVSPLPQIDYPTISVSASLPGASPETMAASVAAPLERQFSHISDVSEMTSTSSLGSTSIVLQLNLNRNIDGAARDVQAAINAARSELPATLTSNPTYRKVNPSESPVLILSITSDAMKRSKLYDIASSILAQKLSQVEGIGQVIVGGSSLPAVRIELNPEILNKYGINLNDIKKILKKTSTDLPDGYFENAKNTWGVKTNDQLFDADQYRNLVVTYRSGAAVRLNEIADVQDSVEDVRNEGFVNGKPAIMIILFREPQANIIATVDRVMALLPQLKSAIPPSVGLSVIMDHSTTIRASLAEARNTIIYSCVFVVIVILLFLRSFRSACIPGVIIPVSLISTFCVMYIFGFSIDNLSMMALTIATGFVVDDAIVVMENIARHASNGLSPMNAALAGVREIGFTICSISISLIAVFIPILLMGGIVGRLFREFAVVLSAAILISLFFSLTTTPMMCVFAFKKIHNKEAASGHGNEDMSVKWYGSSLRWALRHKSFMMSLVLLAIAFSIILFVYIPKGFFPQQDTRRLSGYVQASQDISFQSMKEKLLKIVNIIQEHPAVESVTAFTGSRSGGTRNIARMFIGLKENEKRQIGAEQVISDLREKLNSIPGAPTYLQSVQDLKVGGKSSAAQYQYTLESTNLNELMKWAPLLKKELQNLPQLQDVNSNQQNKGIETTLLIDRNTASRLGITSKIIDETLYSAFGQEQVSTISTELNQYHVVMEVEPKFWQKQDTLRNLYVTSSTGIQVPLSAFARYKETSTPLSICHLGQFPEVTISFNLSPGYTLGQAVAAIEKASRKIGLPQSIYGSFQGTARAFESSMANEPLLILAALISVYIVLGILYESFIHPITILSTLPSAGTGAILALLLFHMDFNIISLIGLILLIGIVKKNGILIVDFALTASRKEGKTPEEAVFKACMLRFRPIMMTTAAAIFGALPLALCGGIGHELRRPLGITIIGGLLFSQMLTLYTTPVIYLYMNRLNMWLENRHKGR